MNALPVYPTTETRCVQPTLPDLAPTQRPTGASKTFTKEVEPQTTLRRVVGLERPRIQLPVQIRFTRISQHVEASRGLFHQSTRGQFSTANTYVVVVPVDFLRDGFRRSRAVGLQVLENLVVGSRHPLGTLSHLCSTVGGSSIKVRRSSAVELQ